MAIFHCDFKLVQRSAGSSAVATSAYIAGEKLQDERCEQMFDYGRKKGVVHSEIMAPKEAPAWVMDRGVLWNQVEAAEHRKDAQLARHLIVALPKELTFDQQLELTQSYVRENFVSAGMVADFSIHHDKPSNPHAHILLTLREVSEQGFGLKNREWNLKSNIYAWRENWAKEVNQALERAGIEASVSQKSLQDRGIDLIPNIHLGASTYHQYSKGEAGLDRALEHNRICEANGNRIIVKPEIGLAALLDSKSTFSEKDIAWIATKHSVNLEQYNLVYQAIRSHDSVVELGRNEQSEKVFTVQSVLEKEKQLIEAVYELNRNAGHGVNGDKVQALPEYQKLNEGQRNAVDFITGEGDIKCVVGYAGTGKSTMLEAARIGWERAGYEVKGMCLAGKAAEELSHSAKIKSETIDYYIKCLENGREVFTRKDVLVVDEANMAGLKKMIPILAEASRVGAKVVLVGDSEQLSPVKDSPVFKYISKQTGYVILDEVIRQKNENHKAATVCFGEGKTGEGVAIYEREGAIQFKPDRKASIEMVAKQWAEDKSNDKLMLALMREDVLSLNKLAREQLIHEGKLEVGKAYRVDSGERLFSVGEKIVFGENDKTLGIKNGTRAEIISLHKDKISVKLNEKQNVAINLKAYNKFDYAYATTIHKAEGMTVDNCYVLMTHHCKSNETNVAMTRHRHKMKCVVDASSIRSMQSLKHSFENKREMNLAVDHAALHGLKPTLEQAAKVIREKEDAQRVQAVLKQDLSYLKAYLGDKAIRYAFKNERVIGVVKGDFSSPRTGQHSIIKTEKGSVLVAHDPGVSALKGCLVDLKISRDRIELGHVLRADLATQKFIDIKAPKMEFNLPKQFEGRVIDRFEQNDKSYLRVMTPDKKLLCVPERPGMEAYMGKDINVQRHNERQWRFAVADKIPQKSPTKTISRELER
ncbi:MAG: Ti-type conjugative transfer relaxase TraA [Gammaproteobacteria bacterium]